MTQQGGHNIESARLFLIRHGSTASNAVRYGGWEDEPLDKAGQEQTLVLAHELAGEVMDAIFASPLSRARDTAMPLAEARGLSIGVREALKEINYGAYQGRPKDVHPLNIRKKHVYEPMPGGESLADVGHRLDAFLPELGECLTYGKRVAVVGHFWTNRLLFGKLMKLPLDDMISQLHYKPKNASVLEVSFLADGQGELSVRTAEMRCDHNDSP